MQPLVAEKIMNFFLKKNQPRFSTLQLRKHTKKQKSRVLELTGNSK